MTRTPPAVAAWIDRSVWRRADVADARSFTMMLSDDAREELARAAARLRGRPRATLRAGDAEASGALAELVQRTRDQLKDGRGFVLWRGVTPTDLPVDEVELRFLTLGLLLGDPVPQNLRGELLTHVRDTGADPNAPSTRLYTTRAEQEFHTDGADIIGLWCRRTARAGGASRIVSSGALVQEIQETRPDLYAVLLEDFPWHYQEDGQPPLWFVRPICTVSTTTRHRNVFFVPWYILRSQELPDAPRLTPAQREAIELLVALANDPRFFLDMTFAPGDVQWLKNAAILHKRTAYQDHEESDRKRHLLRLWLSAPDFLDGDAQLRAGIAAPEQGR